MESLAFMIAQSEGVKQSSAIFVAMESHESIGIEAATTKVSEFIVLYGFGLLLKYICDKFARSSERGLDGGFKIKSFSHSLGLKKFFE